MPLYEFKCTDCGVFDQWRTMAESSHPAYCPTCQEPAKRIFSAPMLLTGSLRLNKKANPEPQLVQRSNPEPVTPKLRSHAEGRPWMISH
jgi:putative FmdB family regulatory protein